MESKILYSLMLDRASLSAKNGWLDEDGKVFIYYKLDRIMTDMQRIDVMERGSINSMTDHYLKELLKPLQEQCIEDRDKCAKIAHIEITFFYLLNWQDMKCFQMVEIAKRNNVSERTIYRYKEYYDKLREKEE